jgi:hypothetical protein
MSTEEIQKGSERQDQEKKVEPEKELTDEELENASGGSFNFTAPTPPVISPEINTQYKPQTPFVK